MLTYNDTFFIRAKTIYSTAKATLLINFIVTIQQPPELVEGKAGLRAQGRVPLGARSALVWFIVTFYHLTF